MLNRKFRSYGVCSDVQIELIYHSKIKVQLKLFGGSCVNLKNKIGPTLQPVFASKKLEQDLKPKEAKPSIVNQHSLFNILYLICVKQIMSATQPDTFFNVLLNTKICSVIGKYFQWKAHGRSDLLNECHFKILRMCQGKFDC